MPGPPGDKAGAEQACDVLGIHMYDPPLPLPRIPALRDGKECLVFRSEQERQVMLHRCRAEVQRRCISGAR